MNIYRGADSPFGPADTKTFVGPAQVQHLADADAGTPVKVYKVRFESGARTNWHAHSGPQWLFVVEGRIRVQSVGGAAQDVEAGDAVMIPPGEKHWHGAVPGERGIHLAVNVDFATTWLEPVSDEGYEATSGRP